MEPQNPAVGRLKYSGEGEPKSKITTWYSYEFSRSIDTQLRKVSDTYIENFLQPPTNIKAADSPRCHQGQRDFDICIAFEPFVTMRQQQAHRQCSREVRARSKRPLSPSCRSLALNNNVLCISYEGHGVSVPNTCGRGVDVFAYIYDGSDFRVDMTWHMVHMMRACLSIMINVGREPRCVA